MRFLLWISLWAAACCLFVAAQVRPAAAQDDDDWWSTTRCPRGPARLLAAVGTSLDDGGVVEADVLLNQPDGFNLIFDPESQGPVTRFDVAWTPPPFNEDVDDVPFALVLAVSCDKIAGLLPGNSSAASPDRVQEILSMLPSASYVEWNATAAASGGANASLTGSTLEASLRSDTSEPGKLSGHAEESYLANFDYARSVAFVHAAPTRGVLLASCCDLRPRPPRMYPSALDGGGGRALATTLTLESLAAYASSEAAPYAPVVGASAAPPTAAFMYAPRTGDALNVVLRNAWGSLILTVSPSLSLSLSGARSCARCNPRHLLAVPWPLTQCTAQHGTFFPSWRSGQSR